MIKLFIGGKGSGKTKTLIDMVNNAVTASNGNVICIEKGEKLRHEVTYNARLVNTDAYAINDATDLYGFIAGILASNSDITDVFVDSALKICNNDAAAFDIFVEEVNTLTAKLNIKVTMTSSIPTEEASETVKKYL